MKPSLLLILMVIAVGLFSCQRQNKMPAIAISAGSTEYSIVEGRNGPMSHQSFVEEIEAANRQFAISDSQAKATVLGIKEFTWKVNQSYTDTNCHNYLFVGGLPTTERPIWLLQIMEVCSGAGAGNNRVFIDVNANTGEITSITDYDVSINDVYYSVEEWQTAARKIK